MTAKKRIVVAPGDGVGPEIMDATLRIIEAAAVPLDYETVALGQSVFEKGISSGIEPRAWDLMRETGVLLKGPITTPQGKGFKSVNVTIRKTLNLFANVRPCKSYAPSVASAHPGMNLVIILMRFLMRWPKNIRILKPTTTSSISVRRVWRPARKSSMSSSA